MSMGQALTEPKMMKGKKTRIGLNSIIVTIVVFVAILFASTLWPTPESKAQKESEISWRLVSFSVDLQKEKSRITELMKSGQMPHGLAYSDGRLYVLFTHGMGLFKNVSHWKLNYHERKGEALSKEIGKNLAENWLPVGMASVRKKLAVLYLKIDNAELSDTLERWDIIRYKSWAASEKGLDKKVKANHIPVGLESIENQVWVFYLKFRKPSGFTAWAIQPTKLSPSQNGNNRRIRTDINKMIREGYYPLGITMTSEQFIGLYPAR